MVSIDLLKNHSDCIPQLAKIWHEVLGKIWLPDIPISRVEERFVDHLNDNRMPLTCVAFQNKKPVGMCSLRENDGIRPDLKPWLGSLVVDPNYQHQGIGESLIDATKQKAIFLGFKKLYLFAFDPTIPDYYERLGWNNLGIDEFKDYKVTVMDILL